MQDEREKKGERDVQMAASVADLVHAIVRLPAVFSPCRTYRYVLWREWMTGDGYVMFIGLNPSKADETHDDPTIRRCIGFAKRWGYQALCMMNLFAFRATDPKAMFAATDPIGPDNDEHFIKIAQSAGVIVMAWGNDGAARGRGAEVAHMIDRPLYHLGLTRLGQPKHPLYLRGDCRPALFQGV